MAALRTCLPEVGKTALALLHSPEAPPLMRTQVQQTIMRLETILHSQPSYLLSEAEGAVIKRRLRLLCALIEVRACFRDSDKECLHCLTRELETLLPDDEVKWEVLLLARVLLAQQQHARTVKMLERF